MKDGHDCWFEYIASESDEGIMIRDLLRKKIGLSRGLIRRLKWGEGIYVNGEQARVRYVLKPGDRIILSGDADGSERVVSQPIPLDVVYEDQDFLVVNKPPGMVVHPVRQWVSGTLLNALEYYIRQRGLSGRPRLIHRIDKDTSGLIVVSLNPLAHQRIVESIGNGTFERTYRAVVHGVVSKDEGVIDAPIKRDPSSLITRMVADDGQRSVTRFKTLLRTESATLLELTLDTGRTHQIRVHLSHIGHPIIGDDLYGGRIVQGMTRQALHSFRLRMRKPSDGTEFVLEADLPEDMKKLLDQIIYLSTEQ